MKTIAILGATGLVGKNILVKLNNSNYKIKLLVRNSSKIEEHKANELITIIEGDYFNPKSLITVVDDAEVVISTIGPPLKGKVSKELVEKYKKGFDQVIETLNASSVNRFINISGAGTVLKGEKLSIKRRFIRFILKQVGGPIYEVKDYELKKLEKSNLFWTSIRPTMIKENVSGDFISLEKTLSGQSVDVEQLAQFIIDQIESEKWIRKAPIVGTK